MHESSGLLASEAGKQQGGAWSERARKCDEGSSLCLPTGLVPGLLRGYARGPGVVHDVRSHEAPTKKMAAGQYRSRVTP